MSRGLIVAPAGVDPRALLALPPDAPGLVRLSQAAGGDVWDTIRFAALRARAEARGVTALRFYGRVPGLLRDEPRGVWSGAILVRRFGSLTDAIAGARWMPATALGAGDYFHIRNARGIVRVGVRASLVAGDRPLEWRIGHAWAGADDAPEADTD